MKKWGIFIIIMFILVGCRHVPFGSDTVIDWVDFIKWNDKEYDGIHSGVLADQRFIGEKVGTVKFKVADNVNNPNYKIKNGDAAFHPKGTELYEIKGHPELLAVKSPQSINGFQVYFSRDDVEYKWHFKDMPIENVKKIDIYKAYTSEGFKLLNELTKDKEINSFLKLLVDSKTNNSFEPNSEKGDPIYYEMVFYTDDPIAYKYGMQFDGTTYFWHPWETSVIPDEINLFIGDN